MLRVLTTRSTRVNTLKNRRERPLGLNAAQRQPGCTKPEQSRVLTVCFDLEETNPMTRDPTPEVCIIHDMSAPDDTIALAGLLDAASKPPSTAPESPPALEPLALMTPQSGTQ